MCALIIVSCIIKRFDVVPSSNSSTKTDWNVHSSHFLPFLSPVFQAWHWTQLLLASHMPSWACRARVSTSVSAHYLLNGHNSFKLTIVPESWLHKRGLAEVQSVHTYTGHIYTHHAHCRYPGKLSKNVNKIASVNAVFMLLCYVTENL